MALEGAPGAFRLSRWIDLQEDICNLSPSAPLCIGVKEAEIGDQVLLIVISENFDGRRLVFNSSICARLEHRHDFQSPERSEPVWHASEKINILINTEKSSLQTIISCRSSRVETRRIPSYTDKYREVEM
jgi:hypothetical protein